MLLSGIKILINFNAVILMRFFLAPYWNDCNTSLYSPAKSVAFIHSLQDFLAKQVDYKAMATCKHLQRYCAAILCFVFLHVTKYTRCIIVNVTTSSTFVQIFHRCFLEMVRLRAKYFQTSCEQPYAKQQSAVKTDLWNKFEF